jgi:nucleoside phosphorylase
VESTEKDIDLLIATALTEEAQVVSAVMSRVAKEHHKRGHVIVHEYFLGDGTAARVATASAHQMGAVNMGVFIAPLLNDLRPRSTTLVGIAAAIDAGEVALGDVPFASQVLSYDDIAVEASTLTFRTEGYPVDPRMRHAVGALRTSRSAYAPWQDGCLAVIGGVIEDASRLRRRAVKRPEMVEPPHLIVGVTAGGPFLLRDRGFSDSLREHPKERELAGARIGVAAPVHPKLVSAEMESHGFMRAAHEHGVPATVIKGISDVGDQEKASLEKETGGSIVHLRAATRCWPRCTSCDTSSDATWPHLVLPRCGPTASRVEARRRRLRARWQAQGNRRIYPGRGSGCTFRSRTGSSSAATPS